MKKILLLLFIPIFSFGQKDAKLDNYIRTLFQEFPLDSSETFIKEHIKNCPVYESHRNIYDSTRLDYHKTVNLDRILKFKPLSSILTFNYSYEWNSEKTIMKFWQVTILKVFYGDSLQKECKKQFKELVNDLKAITGKNIYYEVYEDFKYAGNGFDFYRKKKDKFPFLNIHITSKNYLFIEYHKELTKYNNSPQQLLKAIGADS